MFLDRISVPVDNTVIKRVQQTKSLGLSIDDNLKWKNHINAIRKKISSGIGALKRVRRFICKDTAEKIYHSLITQYKHTEDYLKRKTIENYVRCFFDWPPCS